MDLLGLTKVLACVSITAAELKKLLELMESDNDFPYRFDLLDMLSEIASDSLTGHCAQISEFWNIQRLNEFILVPEIDQWSANTPTSGFVFHASVRLSESHENHQCSDESAKYFFRRQLLHLGSGQGTGFEIFLSSDGSLSLGAITKKDYYAVTCSEARLFDNKWHTVTVTVVPSKRPFSYFNVSMFKDGEPLLCTNLKINTAHEKFTSCSIGAPPLSSSSESSESVNAGDAPPPPPAAGRGLFPSIFEKALPSIVTQAPTYFTFPLKGFSSQDSNIKTVANGLQDNIFGAPTSLQGQISSVLLADSGMSVKALFETGETERENYCQRFLLTFLSFPFRTPVRFDNLARERELRPIYANRALLLVHCHRRWSVCGFIGREETEWNHECSQYPNGFYSEFAVQYWGRVQSAADFGVFQCIYRSWRPDDVRVQ